jgi:capsular polysaccharide biosynthesis protein
VGTTAIEFEREPFLKDVVRTIRKRAWIIVLVAAIFVGAAAGFTLLQPPSYEASARLLVGQNPAEGSNAQAALGSEIMGLQQATQTVALAVDSDPVAEGAAEELNLATDPRALLGNLEVEQMEATQFLELRYADSDPERAQKVANTIADVAAKRVSESAAGASGIRTTVWQYAPTPENPVTPGPLRNGLLALGLGLMLGVGLSFLLEYLDDSWHSPEEVERISGVPNFGVISQFAMSAKRGG